MQTNEPAWQRLGRGREAYVDSVVQGTAEEAWEAIVPLLVDTTITQDGLPVIWESPPHSPAPPLALSLVRRFRERYGLEAMHCFEASLCHLEPVVAAYAIVGIGQDRGALEGAMRILGNYPNRAEKLYIAGGSFMDYFTLSGYAAQEHRGLVELEREWYESLLQHRERRYWAALRASAGDYIRWFDEHMDGYLLYAEALFELRQFDSAFKVLEQIIGHPSAVPDQVQLARVRFNQIRAHIASVGADASVDSRENESAEVLIPRAVNKLASGNFAEARQCLTEAMACPKGDLGDLHCLIADTYRCEGNLSLAIGYYESALVLSPDHQRAKLHCDDVQHALHEENYSPGA